jgi:hypothetical protein
MSSQSAFISPAPLLSFLGVFRNARRASSFPQWNPRGPALCVGDLPGGEGGPTSRGSAVSGWHSAEERYERGTEGYETGAWGYAGQNAEDGIGGAACDYANT